MRGLPVRDATAALYSRVSAPGKAPGRARGRGHQHLRVFLRRSSAPCYAAIMKPARRRPATYADLRRAPEQMVAEIIEGELVTSPRPASRHAFVSSVMLS